MFVILVHVCLAMHPDLRRWPVMKFVVGVIRPSITSLAAGQSLRGGEVPLSAVPPLEFMQ